MPQQADYWLQKAVDFCLNHHDYAGYIFHLQEQVDILTRTHKARQALNLLINAVKIIKVQTEYQKMDIADAFSSCYAALGEFEKAKPHFIVMKKLFYKLYIKRANGDMTNWTYYYYRIISFYLNTKQFNAAITCLKEVDALPNAIVDAWYKSKFELYHFKVDSAGRNYISAIRHYQLFKSLNDSLFTEEKVKKINELEIKYEAGRKDRSIALLKNKALAQETKLQKAAVQRNVTFCGIAMLLIALGMFYNSYRNKQQSNRQLQTKQTEINLQNHLLQNTLNDKDRLIIEKEWLLKEVHHRVKNNLQIVMSLLNTQSAYLKNTAAVAAIKESQNWVQAISLIHQKLYSTTGITTIYMPDYISDLIKYLADSFDAKCRKVIFNSVIEPVRLDLVQAVPLGLILNEAITNAIKYAFGHKGGQIVVELNKLCDETVLLTISDNGIGLPRSFRVGETNSLGMEMMKALSGQLGGEFVVTNNSGVHVMVQFRIEQVHYKAVAEACS
nr:sensor histidine kinase [Mucilaginibacter sp. L294]